MEPKKENRGGARKGAGRPKVETIPYYRRVTRDQAEKLDELLNQLKTLT